MACSAFWKACLLLGLSQFHVEAQVKVMTPKWLADKFRDSHARIEGSTATFGAPYYGDRVLGKVVFPESKGNVYCTEEDYDLPARPEQTGENNKVQLIPIVVVRRGKCSFVTKVRIAQKKGARAVIIVDRADSDLTSNAIRNLIVADDGYGSSVEIPSILVSKYDGEELIKAVSQANENPVDSPKVVVELGWDVPTNKVVNMDLWMSSASRESLEFLKNFSPRRKVLNEVVSFTPHYVVFSTDSSDPAVYNEICTDSSAEFCTEDPDGSGPITGKDILEEDVRQLCIHELTKVSRRAEAEAEEEKRAVDYAEKFWDYMERFAEACPLDGLSEETRFGEKCSVALMNSIGLNADSVLECSSRTKTEKLRHERQAAAWSPRALRINGWRYSGTLDADLVTRAVCAGFTTRPDECDTLINAPQMVGTGITVGTFVGTLLAVTGVILGLLCLYNRSLKAGLKQTVREEIMLEVQSQMAAYQKL